MAKSIKKVLQNTLRYDLGQDLVVVNHNFIDFKTTPKVLQVYNRRQYQLHLGKDLNVGVFLSFSW